MTFLCKITLHVIDNCCISGAPFPPALKSMFKGKMVYSRISLSRWHAFFWNKIFDRILTSESKFIWKDSIIVIIEGAKSKF